MGVSYYFATLAVVALTCCLQLAIPSTLDNPFGLTFTPTTVIASRYNATGSVEYTREPLGSDYKAFYQQAVHQFETSPDQKYDDGGVQAIFRKAIAPVTEVLTRQLGHAPNYSALFLPSIFDHRVGNDAMDVAVHDRSKKATMGGAARRAMCTGYRFLECKNLGRDFKDCNEDGPLNLILAFEYEKEYLYVWLMEVAFDLDTYPARHERFYIEGGERYRNASDYQEYEAGLKSILDDFISDPACQSYHGYNYDSIRAIVLTGEASTSAMTALGNLALDAVGTDAVRIMTEIDPSEVVAHGTAVWALMTHESPHVFVGDPGFQITQGHDEL